jgi:4'-phosphopantetheinyl transferase
LKSGQASDAQRLLHTLSTDEIERAERFRFGRDRARFILARGTLRTLLGHYLGADPASLSFSHNDYGKPALAGEWTGSGVNFNLSHSHEVVLYAFARGRAVGIDVEHVRPELSGEDIAARFFSAPETEALRSQPPNTRPSAFFSCWTRKEAYIKARGEGLSYALDRFAVSVDSGAQDVVLDVFGDAAESRRWTIISLLPDEGYVAALAAEGTGWHLNYWRANQDLKRRVTAQLSTSTLR